MKRVILLFGFAVLAYMAVAGWLYYKQRDLLFVRDADPAPLEGFWLQTDNHKQIWIDKLNPNQPNALIYFPGNTASDWDDPRRLSKALPRHTIYFMRYRGYANSQGRPSQKALYKDALKLYDMVKRGYKSVDIAGRSLGTAMAVYTASQRLARRLVLVTPFDGITIVAQKRYAWLPVKYLLKDPFPSVKYAPNVEEQTLIILAKWDQTIPYQSSENLIEHFSKKPEVVMLRGKSHSTIVRHPLYLKTIANFLDR